MAERAHHLRDEGGIIANNERAAGEREGNPLLAGPARVFGSDELVDGQRAAAVGGDLRALLLDHPRVHLVDEAAGLGIMTRDVHQHDSSQLACRRLDGAERILAAGDLQQVVEREPQPAESAAIGAFKLCPHALDERLHARIFEQEAILRAVETLAEFRPMGDAHPASGRGGKDFFARWKSGVGSGNPRGPNQARKDRAERDSHGGRDPHDAVEGTDRMMAAVSVHKKHSLRVCTASVCRAQWRNQHNRRDSSLSFFPARFLNLDYELSQVEHVSSKTKSPSQPPSRRCSASGKGLGRLGEAGW